MTDDELIEELARAMAGSETSDDWWAIDRATWVPRAKLVIQHLAPIIKREASKTSDFQTAVAYDCGIRAGQEDERKAVVEWVKKDFYGGKRLADAIEAGEHRK